MINNKRIHLRSIYILIFLNNSFVKNNILVFFLYNQKLHKTINYSRLYNTYHNVRNWDIFHKDPRISFLSYN